jgi:hypothetical protein
MRTKLKKYKLKNTTKFLEKKKIHSHLSAAVLTTRAILGAALPPI